MRQNHVSEGPASLFGLFISDEAMCLYLPGVENARFAQLPISAHTADAGFWRQPHFAGASHYQGWW